MLPVLSPAPCSQDDLDAIKLLKRELAVAIREEDYSTAARIRDHPFMRMYREMWMNRCVFSSARNVSACIGALLHSVSWWDQLVQPIADSSAPCSASCRLLGHEAAAERVEGELKQLIERNT